MIVHFGICTLLPILNYILAIYGKEGIVLANDLSFPLMIVKMIFYPIIGYYIDRVVDIHKMTKKHLLILAISAFCGMYIESFITIHQGRTFGTYTQNYVQLFDYVIAIAFFVLVKYLFECKRFLCGRDMAQKGICTIGGLTLGMYVLDPVWKTVFWWKFQSVLEPLFPTLLVSICWCLMSMLGSAIVSFVLKKIPGIKRII